MDEFFVVLGMICAVVLFVGLVVLAGTGIRFLTLGCG